jgi:sugar phosphate isomerase/epimerase
MTKRRDFLRHAATAAVGTAFAGVASRRAHAALPGSYGVQLYTLRNVLPTKPAETMSALHAIGYREVEMLRAGLASWGPAAKDAGLAVPAMHIEAPIVTGDWTAWRTPGAEQFLPPSTYGIDAAIADAKKHDIRFLTVAYLMQAERTSLDFYRRFADAMTRAGEKCAAAGITLCYHHHSFEYEPLEGKLPMDLLVERFDRKKVGFEIDVFWVSIAGADPVKTIRDLGSRVRLLHLKDKTKGTANEFQERNVKAEAFAEVGSGVVDFAGVLAAGRAVGVAHAFVEQDQTPGDPVESLRKSYGFLAGLK